MVYSFFLHLAQSHLLLTGGLRQRPTHTLHVKINSLELDIHGVGSLLLMINPFLPKYTLNALLFCCIVVYFTRVVFYFKSTDILRKHCFIHSLPVVPFVTFIATNPSDAAAVSLVLSWFILPTNFATIIFQR